MSIANIPNLDGNTAIVTGASRGFGRATAVALAAAGVHVVGVARSEPELVELQRQLGTSFTPVVADVSDNTIASRLITEFRPRIVVLNAGATPVAASLQGQTWETFSQNWDVDVRHVFHFVREALVAPLDAGSVVVSMSSGAARMGSPMSGGYAGAKSTIGFINSYAGAESLRHSLGIRFVALLPQLTPATGLGTTFVDAYADYAGVDRGTFLERFGTTLTAEDVAAGVVAVVAGSDAEQAPAYLLTANGLSPCP